MAIFGEILTNIRGEWNIYPSESDTLEDLLEEDIEDTTDDEVDSDTDEVTEDDTPEPKREPIVEFTSFVSISVSGSSSVTSYPIEQGGFTDVNKTNQPLSITVVLAKDGNKDEIATVISTLMYYRDSTELVDIITPAQTYLYMNITSFDYTQTAYQNATTLMATLTLQEIRQITPEYSLVDVQNPETAETQDTGKTQAEEVEDRSTLDKIAEGVSNWWGSLWR